MAIISNKTNVLYAYKNNVESNIGLLKVGMTTCYYTGKTATEEEIKNSALKRVKEQGITAHVENTMVGCLDIKKATDKDVHRYLKESGTWVGNRDGATEWFNIDWKSVVIAAKLAKKGNNGNAKLEVELVESVKAFKNNNSKIEQKEYVQGIIEGFDDDLNFNAKAKRRAKTNAQAVANANAKNALLSSGVSMDEVSGFSSFKGKAVKSDNEYYTIVETIRKEIFGNPKYLKALKGKTILCPCDDTQSAFYRFFRIYFKELGVKKVIFTSYTKSSRVSDKKRGMRRYVEHLPAQVLTLTENKNGDGIHHTWYYLPEAYDGKTVLLDRTIDDNKKYSDGDCTSFAIINLMKQVDIVCTNPPFGGIGYELIKQCIAMNKDFLIIEKHNTGAKNGLVNCFGSKWRFGDAKEGSFIFGMHTDTRLRYRAEGKKFKTVDDIVDVNLDTGVVKSEKVEVYPVTCQWYTTLLDEKSHKEYAKSLMSNYYYGNEEQYPIIENVENAIAVLNKNCRGDVKCVPCDFDGLMLVPVSFMYNNFDSRYFEIVSNGNLSKDVALPLSDVTKQKYLEQTGNVASNGVCWYTNADGIVKGCGGLYLLIKWKVKEREALKKELGL